MTQRSRLLLEPARGRFSGEPTSPKGPGSQPGRENEKPKRGATGALQTPENLLLQADGKPDRLTVK